MANKREQNNQRIESSRLRLMELQSDITRNPIKKVRNKKEIKSINTEIERFSKERSQHLFVLGAVIFVVASTVILAVMAIRGDSQKEAKSSTGDSNVTVTDKVAEPNSDVEKSEKKDEYSVERFELAQGNDYSTMHSRDERVFSIYAYPAGITVDDFKIVRNWEEYINISDVNVKDKGDKSEISFKVSMNPSILKKSTAARAMIALIANTESIESEKMLFPIQAVEISDAEDLTIKIGSTQTATFKVVPASLPLEELKIEMNAYVGNIEAKIVDSERDYTNNCQYVHVEILVTGKHNGLSTGYVNLSDIYQLTGGQSSFNIVE